MEMADRFDIPVLALVDTAGAYPGIDAEERGQAEAMRVTAPDLLALGVVDGIIPEPPGGAHTDPEWTCRRVGETLEETLTELERLSIHELLARRYDRFRHLGAFDEG